MEHLCTWVRIPPARNLHRVQARYRVSHLTCMCYVLHQPRRCCRTARTTNSSTCGRPGSCFTLCASTLLCRALRWIVVWESNWLLTPRRLSGTLPFYADNPDDFLELVLSSSFTFPDSEWADVSEGRKLLPEPSSHISGLNAPDALFCGPCNCLLCVAPNVLTRKSSDSHCLCMRTAKDLIRKILVPDPKKRMNVRDILAHPWLAVRRTPVSLPLTCWLLVLPASTSSIGLTRLLYS